MSNPELHFKTKTELLEWFKKNLSESLAEYFAVQETVRESGFSGSAKLLARAADEKVDGFTSFLTELNLARLLMTKEVKNICYEPKQIPGIDFSYDNTLLSIKNLQLKDYERTEHDEIERLISAGGGKNTLSHKKPALSETFIEVEKNEMGTYTRTRTETGSSGFLESDIYQMSPPLKYIGEFENLANVDGHKKVLFIMSYSEDFMPYYADDIGFWYFGYGPRNYRFIFANDPSWYFKLLRAKKKQQNIDALVFMFPPNPLIWPENCFSQTLDKEEHTRVLIYTRDAQLRSTLQNIFSGSGGALH